MANRKNTPGIIGLGSRLFLAKESTWGTAINTLANFEQYNLYPQPGGRPQKTTTPIEVTQLYPSAIRRKPLKGVSSVEGSLTFALPKTNNKLFWEMITGSTGSGIVMSGLDPEDPSSNIIQGTENSNNIKITNTNANPPDDFTELAIGDIVTIAGITSTREALSTSFNAWDFKLGATIDGGTGALVNDGVYLQVTTTADISSDLTIGDPITLTGIPAGSGTNPNAYSQIIGNSNEIAWLDGTTITLDHNFDNMDTITNETQDPDAMITGVINGAGAKVNTGGQDDSEIAQLNGPVQVTHGGGANVDAEGNPVASDNTLTAIEINLPWSIITGLQHPLSNTPFTVAFPGGTYGLSETISNSYTFVNTIGNGRIAQYSGMSPSSLTISVGTDSTISTEIGFLGKDEVVEDVSLVSIGAFMNGGSNTNEPFTLSGGNTAISKISATHASTFDNYNDVYPSWATTLRIARKNSPYVAGNAYQYLATDGTWTNIPSSVNALADFKAQQESIIPFSDLTLTIENNLEFSNYVNGSQNRTAPVQTSFRDVTLGITIPYNKFTSPKNIIYGDPASDPDKWQDQYNI